MNTRQYEKSNHYLEEALRICKQLSNPHVPPPLRQMVIEPAAAVIELVVIEPVEMSKCRTVIELAVGAFLVVGRNCGTRFFEI